MDVLIVVDIQNDFISGIFGTPEAQKIVPKIAKFIERFNGLLEVTLDEHLNVPFLPTIEENLLQKHCIIDSEGSRIHSDIENVLLDRQVWRTSKRTFGTLNLCLYDVLDDYDISNIYVCGLCTDICVLNNAIILRNKLPKHKIIVLSDLCAGTTPENHQKALDIMKMNCIEIKTSEEIK